MPLNRYRKEWIPKLAFFQNFRIFQILAGGRCPPDPPGLAEEGKASRDPAPKQSYRRRIILLAISGAIPLRISADATFWRYF